MSRYNNHRLEELAQQLRLSNRQLRLQQIQAAERFLRTLDVQQTYSYGEVVYALTGYRTRLPSGSGIPGRAVLSDLAALIEDLSLSLRQTIQEAPEPTFTSDQLAERFDVSLKTIGRWRRLGLVARRYVQPETRPILGFGQSGVDWFVEKHPELVAKGKKFTQMTPDERQQIVELARKLHAAVAELSITQLAKQVAQKVGRSVETIRYTLHRFDLEHPQEAIFAERPCDLEIRRQAEEVLHGLKCGEAMTTLAARLGVSTDEVTRLAHEERFRRLSEYDLSYLPSPEFKTPGAAVRLLAVELPVQQTGQLLTPAEEREAFRQYNFRKHLLAQKIETMRTGDLNAATLAEAENDLAQIIALRNWIIQCNVRLVVRIARQHVGPGQDFADAVSEGNLALMRAVEGFDYSRNFRFCTYASWAIMRTLASHLPAEAMRNRKVIPVENDLLTLNPDLRALPPEYAADRAGIKVAVNDLLRQLSDREQAVLVEHFGLGSTQESTLQEIGQRWGLSKERVRQIKQEALAKLRELVPQRQ